MPTSQHYQVSKILDLIININPQAVLDVGTGFGKYGFLCREYLDIWEGKQDYKKFTRRIDGIEVFPDYLTPVHAFVYDEVLIGNALDVVESLKRSYDLALLIDVLEHFEKPDGIRLLKSLLGKTRFLAVSVPKDIGEQGEMFHNSHEAHLATWVPRDFLALSPMILIPDRVSYLVLLGPKAELERLGPIVAPSPLRLMKRTLKDAWTSYRDMSKG